MLSKFAIGVHFSHNHVFIVCLEKNLSNIQVKEHAQIDLSEESTIVQRLENLEGYLTRFIESNGISEPEIYISFPSEASIVRQLKFPSSVKDDLASTINYSLENYIPLKAEDLYFDFSILSEDKENNTLNVLLGAVKKTDLKPFIDLAVSIEAGISGVQFPAAAIANFICNDRKLNFQSTTNVFVLYLDEKTLDIIFFKKGQFNYTRQIQLVDDSSLQEIINNEIQIKKDTQLSKQLDAAVVLCGREMAKKDSRWIEEHPSINLKEHGFGKYALPSEDYIPAVGLALNGLGKKEKFQLNFLPENKRKKTLKTAKYLMYGLTFFGVCLGILWGFSAFMHQNMIHKNLDAQIQRLEGELLEVKDKNDKISKLENEVSMVNKLIKEQVEINDILNELSKIIPSGSWLKNFSFTMGKGIRISGESDNASDLIPILESSKLFENAVFLSAITKNRNGKQKFLIGCDIIQEGIED